MRGEKILEIFDEYDFVDMMYDNEKLDIFKSLWKKNNDLKKWSHLLHSCYWELSYQRVGGDEGYLENPPINMARIKYLEQLVDFLETSGIQAVNDAPKTE